ncbi:MAG: TetR/AcrR family transcriptional regulator C-terminal domain-containing protein [Hyphomicrobiales bacterium]|nr:TetR/AcrR family transcriptional regulator C-terminal domain-containing protein [Hyphomicrobiales bacterium]
MADALIVSVMETVDVGAEPDIVLCSLARALRSALLSRRDGARIYAGTYVMGENVLTVADAVLTALLRKGLDPRIATDAMFNLVYYVLGFCIEEQGFSERWGEETDTSVLRRQFVAATAERFPALSQCAEPILAGSFDDRFERGLVTFLDGLSSR